MQIAAINFDAVFWFVVAILWVIAQIIGQSKQKKRAAPAKPKRPQREPAGSFEENIKDFLETLTGAQGSSFEDLVDELPRETAIEEPPPVPQPVAPAPIPATPYTEPPVPSRVSLDEAYARKHGLSISEEQIEEVSTPSVVSPRSFLVGLDNLKMPLMRVPLSAISSHQLVGGGPSSLRPDFKDKNDIKKAIINAFVLNPPMALQAPGQQLS